MISMPNQRSVESIQDMMVGFCRTLEQALRIQAGSIMTSKVCLHLREYGMILSCKIYLQSSQKRLLSLVQLFIRRTLSLDSDISER